SPCSSVAPHGGSRLSNCAKSAEATELATAGPSRPGSDMEWSYSHGRCNQSRPGRGSFKSKSSSERRARRMSGLTDTTRPAPARPAPPSAGSDLSKSEEGHVFAARGTNARVMQQFRIPRIRRAQEHQVFVAPAASCAKVESTRVSRHRYAETIR